MDGTFLERPQQLAVDAAESAVGHQDDHVALTLLPLDR
jgi:hypothetical protein